MNSGMFHNELKVNPDKTPEFKIEDDNMQHAQNDWQA